MHCLICNKEIDGSYGSGRFCARKCANSFSTKEKREQINRIVSTKLKGRKSSRKRNEEELRQWLKVINTKESKIKSGVTRKKNTILKILQEDFDSLSISRRRKRILLEQNQECFNCKISMWMGHKLVLEIDHIDGNKSNNARSNLVALCPNCHSITPTWRKKKSALVGKLVKSPDLDSGEYASSSLA